MIVPKQLVIFALVIALAYAKKCNYKSGKYDIDHLLHYSNAKNGPQDQATQYVPGQPGIELFVEW